MISSFQSFQGMAPAVFTGHFAGRDPSTVLGSQGVGGHHHDRQATGMQIRDQRHHFSSCPGVQGAGWFIGLQELRLVDKRPCDGHTLLRTSGQLIRPIGQPIG